MTVLLNSAREAEWYTGGPWLKCVFSHLRDSHRDGASIKSYKKQELLKSTMYVYVIPRPAKRKRHEVARSMT